MVRRLAACGGKPVAHTILPILAWPSLPGQGASSDGSSGATCSIVTPFAVRFARRPSNPKQYGCWADRQI